jgi:pyruvate/2-oxoglutarate dehydrogenase complex dihydrolipoamide dehydrogenase (E3) component
VETDKNGFIRHDSKLQTNVPGIWVIGDVMGGPAFTHVSYDDYLVIYDNLVNGKSRTIDKRLIPYALLYGSRARSSRAHGTGGKKRRLSTEDRRSGHGEY